MDKDKSGRKISLNKISKRLLRASTLAAEQLAADIIEDVRPIIPVGTGRLHDSTQTQTEEQRINISWNAPYAKAVYYGDGPGRLWFESAKAANIDKWRKKAAKAFIDEALRD